MQELSPAQAERELAQLCRDFARAARWQVRLKSLLLDIARRLAVVAPSFREAVRRRAAEEGARPPVRPDGAGIRQVVFFMDGQDAFARIGDHERPLRLGRGKMVRTLMLALLEPAREPAGDGLVGWKSAQRLARRVAELTGYRTTPQHVRVEIHRFRDRLAAAGLKREQNLVQSRRGVGYRFALRADGVVQHANPRDAA